MATAEEEVYGETSGDEPPPLADSPDRVVHFPSGSLGENEELDGELD